MSSKKRKRTNNEKKEVSKKQKKNSRKATKSKAPKETKSKEASPVINTQSSMSQPKSKAIPKSTQSSSTTTSSASSRKSSLPPQTFVPYDAVSFSTTPSIPSSQHPSLPESNTHRRAKLSQSQVEPRSGSAQTTQIESSYEKSEEPSPKDFKNGALTSNTLNSIKKSRQAKDLSKAKITACFCFFFTLVALLYISYSHVLSTAPATPLSVLFQLPLSCPNANSTKKWDVKHIQSILSTNLPNHKTAVDQAARSLATLLNGHSKKTTTVLHLFGSNHDAKKILLKNVKTLLYAENLDHFEEFSQNELKDASSPSEQNVNSESKINAALTKLKNRVIEKLKLCNTSLFIINGTTEGREAMYEFEGFFDRPYYETHDKQKLKLTSALFILLSDVNEEGYQDENIKNFFNRPAYVGRILHHINFS